MRRFRVLLICCPLFALIPAQPAAQAQADSAVEFIRLVNDFRAANSMPALAIDPALVAASQGHADWQAVTGSHTHQGAGGSLPQDRATAAGYQGRVSENVTNGTLGYATPGWAVEGWAGSTGHRITMLSQDAHVGAGVAQNAASAYFVLMVGSPSGSAAQSPAPQSTSVAGRSSPAVDQRLDTRACNRGIGGGGSRPPLCCRPLASDLAALPITTRSTER